MDAASADKDNEKVLLAMDDNKDSKRWGVLYCPKGGAGKAAAQWKKVQRALDERSVEYDFVQSENTESVERLMRMLLNNGYKTIVIVGGDSALNDAVNCLMEARREVRESVVLGVIPNGLVNDFARFWDFKESDVAQTVDWLLKRRVRKIDLGCIRYTNKKGEQCHRYFLNCVNIGLTADMMDLRRRTHRLLGSRTLSFVVSSVLMLFHRLEYFMHLRMNTGSRLRNEEAKYGIMRGRSVTAEHVSMSAILFKSSLLVRIDECAEQRREYKRDKERDTCPQSYDEYQKGVRES